MRVILILMRRAFLAISIALFGLSASGVYAYLRRKQLEKVPTERLLANRALLHGGATIVALFVLVRLRVGLNYSPQNLALMLAKIAQSSRLIGWTLPIGEARKLWSMCDPLTAWMPSLVSQQPCQTPKGRVSQALRGKGMLTPLKYLLKSGEIR